MKFEFTDHIVLENDRVILRPIRMQDVEHLLVYSLSEPEIWKHTLVQPIGQIAMENYVEKTITARSLKKEYAWIVFDKKINSFAGSTRFFDIQLENDSLQIGYTWYGKRFQGTGLNKNCKYLLMEFAFEHMAIERIEFRVDVLNEISICALKSLGCSVDGILRSNGCRPDGGRRDSMVLSLLKGEWMSSVKDSLYHKLLQS